MMPLENRREVLMQVATAADRLGYDAFFLTETWGLDATVLLTEAAVRTERVGLGTGIVSVWNRSAGTLAMAASTLASISGGRFVLGLGASTAQLTEGFHDVSYVAPVERLRRTLTQVRALLRGDRIPLAVATAARPLKLNVASPPALPIYLAALADESVRLAGELADGWMPFLYPWARLAEGVERLREGVARREDPERLPGIYPAVPAVVAEDPAKAREGAAWFVAFYLTTMGPLYRQSLVRQGFGKEVAAVLAANTPRMKGEVPSEGEELLEQLVVFGTPAVACRRLQRWHDAGAVMPILLLRPHMTPGEIALTLDAFRPMLNASGRP
jgi:alkanesulfonate monooxygenase SsuD/methylene tetrahydromethanopterin reductase-like flavin-dependent oxidoreductase (luciferase family)